MNLSELLFGRRHAAPTTLTAPPADANWRSIRPKTGPAVSARLAESDGLVQSSRGQMRYRAGADYVVTRADGEQAVVEKSVFERTYRQRDDGKYEKRTDVTYRYFTLTRPVVVATNEGPQRADRGDWIVQGVDGEIWPVTPRRAAEIYDQI